MSKRIDYTLTADQLLAMSREQIWDISLGRYKVYTSDGREVITTSRRLIFSSYAWSVHTHYPKLKLLERHIVPAQELISAGSQTDLLSAVYEDWYYAYWDDPQVDVEDLWWLIYDIANAMYNEFIQRIDDYVSTLSALDFLEALHHPQIKEANRNVKANQRSIDETYRQIDDALLTEGNFEHNAIAQMMRSSLVPTNQVNQCLGPRGFTTEINSMIYKDPITCGYAHGMRKIQDALQESRSASKAMMYAGDPLSECEYFNRRLQLVAQYLKRVHYGDCGSRHTMDWTVKGEHLEILAGMYYHDASGALRVVNKNDYHLVGETIALRTPFSCQHPDPQGICSTCYGQLAISIPRGTNVGHLAAIQIGEKISQLVLSTKHHEGSSAIEEIELDEYHDQYLEVSSDGRSYLIDPSLRDQPLRLVVSVEEAHRLSELFSNKPIGELNPSHVSSIRQVILLIGDPQEPEHLQEVELTLSRGSRLANISRALLEHIRGYAPVSYDKDGDYIISLDSFDKGQPIFELPLKHTNMLDYQSLVKSMLFSVKDNDRSSMKGLSSYTNSHDALYDLCDLILSQLKIHFVHLSCVVLSLAAKDPFSSDPDPRIPKGGESFAFVRYMDLMAMRSMGAKMALERQTKDIINPSCYVNKNRPSHPLDALIKTPDMR